MAGEGRRCVCGHKTDAVCGILHTTLRSKSPVHCQGTESHMSFVCLRGGLLWSGGMGLRERRGLVGEPIADPPQICPHHIITVPVSTSYVQYVGAWVHGWWVGFHWGMVMRQQYPTQCIFGQRAE